MKAKNMDENILDALNAKREEVLNEVNDITNKQTKLLKEFLLKKIDVQQCLCQKTNDDGILEFDTHCVIIITPGFTPTKETVAFAEDKLGLRYVHKNGFIFEYDFIE